MKYVPLIIIVPDGSYTPQWIVCSTGAYDAFSQLNGGTQSRGCALQLGTQGGGQPPDATLLVVRLLAGRKRKRIGTATKRISNILHQKPPSGTVPGRRARFGCGAGWRHGELGEVIGSLSLILLAKN